MCDCNRTTPRGASAAHAPARSHAVGRMAHGPDVVMRYIGAQTMLLKGPTSRRVYAVKPDMEPLRVDPRDANAFLGSPLFAHAI